MYKLMCLRSVVMPEGMFVSLDDCYYAQLVLLRNNLVALMVCTVCDSASIQIVYVGFTCHVNASHIYPRVRVCFPCRFLRSQWVDRFS